MWTLVNDLVNCYPGLGDSTRALNVPEIWFQSSQDFDARFPQLWVTIYKYWPQAAIQIVNYSLKSQPTVLKKLGIDKALSTGMQGHDVIFIDIDYVHWFNSVLS